MKRIRMPVRTDHGSRNGRKTLYPVCILVSLAAAEYVMPRYRAYGYEVATHPLARSEVVFIVSKAAKCNNLRVDAFIESRNTLCHAQTIVLSRR